MEVRSPDPSVVMPALVAGIHAFAGTPKDVDGRDKPGHDACGTEFVPKS
jgi:hypothetical protein